MRRLGTAKVITAAWALAILAAMSTDCSAAGFAQGIDRVLDAENREKGITRRPATPVDDLAYLRRVMVDLVGRIPTEMEIQAYLALPAESRRMQTVDKLLQDPQFADRWTIFFADMLRLRSNVEGGAALTAFVHKAVADGMPYDELARGLIAASGKAGQTPEVGFILGDDADPMALAGVTSQVFMGVRIACAQCHDHPFDKWTRKDFYGLAAYFGKTRRVETRFKNRILATYVRDTGQTTVLWPPEGAGDNSQRKPMPPRFPIELTEEDRPSRPIARLTALRAKRNEALAQADRRPQAPSVDDLLDDAAQTAEKRTRGGSLGGLEVVEEAKRDVKQLDVAADGYRTSDFREELAERITDPRNRFFSRSFVNRVWAELVGRGIVEPVDDFSDQNPPSHPQLLDEMADEFIAGGFDLRMLIRSIVTSQAYQRAHVTGPDEAVRIEMESAFLATPTRRMLSEALYDSIVIAGHLGDVKHKAGKNLKVVWREERIPKEPTRPQSGEAVRPMPLAGGEQPRAMPAMKDNARADRRLAGYDLESAIEIDFDAALKRDAEMVMLDQMQVKSKEELEAERMQSEMRRQQLDYVDRFVRTVVDDNPRFSSAMRMASPAPPEHFLRIFGQTSRTDLGEVRDQSPTMRQALMMLNGRLTHEASRVGELEPIYPLLVGKDADLAKAVRLAYREILTREPTAEEVEDARMVVAAAKSPLDGMADLRWVLLNSNEFRFLP